MASSYTITSGFEETLTGRVIPSDNTTWADLTSSPFGSWANWTTWHPEPNSVEVEIIDDNLTSDYRVPQLGLSADGEFSITLDISDTGTFSGEETAITLTSGVISSIVKGRYYKYTITVTADSDNPIPALNGFQTGYTSELLTEIQSDVDVPSTPTDSSGYTVIESNINTIINVQATALQGGLYCEDDYVVSALTQDDYYRIGKTLTNNGVGFTTQAQFGTHSFDFEQSDYFTVPQASSGEFMTNGEDFTVEFWLYIPTGATMTTGNIIRIPKTSLSGDPLLLYVRTTPSLDIFWNTFTDTGGSYANSASLSYDTWHHIALTYAGSSNTINFFVDGSQKFAPTLTGSFDEVSNSVIFGDSASDPDSFEGYVDEVRWSNTRRYSGSSFSVPTAPFINDPNTILLLHADNNFTDDGGIDYGSEEYFITQYGGIAMVQSKNPLAITVTDYNGTAWDGAVDLVIRGLPGVTLSDSGISAA